MSKTVQGRFRAAAKRDLVTTVEAAKKINAESGGGNNNGGGGGKRDPGLPRPPRSAFLYFSGAERKRMGTMEGGNADVMRAIGKRWKELTQDERKEYDEMAAQDKDR